MDFDLPHLIKSLGYVGVWAIIFAESGLLVGFLLPGDSLLFTAGFIASQGLLNIWILILGAFICAVLGDNFGYATGYRFGRRLFDRKDSKWFHKKHLLKAQKFYDKHGKKTIVLARFLPFIRTFAPIIAGIATMNYRIFISYNLIGGLIWTFGITLTGYYLGRLIPDVERYLLPIVCVIIVSSFVPLIFEIIKENESKNR